MVVFSNPHRRPSIPLEGPNQSCFDVGKLVPTDERDLVPTVREHPVGSSRNWQRR